MCGRYFLWDELKEQLQQDFPDMEGAGFAFGAGDVHPSDAAPVIMKGGRRLELIRWGYPAPERAEERRAGALVINARAETAAQKPMFRAGCASRRILIPASGFYEWNSRKEKNTFRMQEDRIMYMAGIYDRFQDEDRFVILTQTANESMSRVHDRMPLIIGKEACMEWLQSDRIPQEILQKTGPQLERSSEYEQMTLF